MGHRQMGPNSEQQASNKGQSQTLKQIALTSNFEIFEGVDPESCKPYAYAYAMLCYSSNYYGAMILRCQGGLEQYGRALLGLRMAPLWGA